MVFGFVLKYFDVMNYIGYELKIKEVLMIKLDDFKIMVKLWKIVVINVQRKEQVDIKIEMKLKEIKFKYGILLFVFYGLNFGIVEGIVGELVVYGCQMGFIVEMVLFDDYIGKLFE